MSEKHDLIIIDDPADPELRQALVTAGTARRELTSAETATLGPLEVRAVDMGRAMVDFQPAVHLEPAPLPPPDRFHVQAEISAVELTALRFMLANLKPRTNVAKAGITALQRLIGSKVAL